MASENTDRATCAISTYLPFLTYAIGASLLYVLYYSALRFVVVEICLSPGSVPRTPYRASQGPGMLHMFRTEICDCEDSPQRRDA